MNESESEKKITELEAEFPTLADGVFAAARAATLKAGYSVLESKDGIIYEVFPDGSRIERDRIEPPTYIPAGTRIVIQ